MPDHLVRPEVLAFARHMSSVMEAKALANPKPLAHIYEALGEIQKQIKKFEDVLPLTEREQAVIFIHIANFAMLGFNLIPK
jgi:hypothetical protein